MTIPDIMKNLSEEDLILGQYYESIQPFEVQPSETYEFDAAFQDEDGKRVNTEITLDEDQEIEDIFCTCGAGGLCAHLAAMMYDMEKRETLSFSACLSHLEQRLLKA